MAQFTNIYEVDLKKPNSTRTLRQIVGEGDAAGMRIGAIVTEDGTAVSLGGACVGKVIRADGATVQLTGTISGNTAYVVLDQQSCAIEGPIQVAVCWVSGSNVTTLVMAYGMVVNTVTGNAIQPSTPIPDLTQLLAAIDEMQEATADAKAAANRALANFASSFSMFTNYSAGDYVTNSDDGKFYRFIVDHAAGAWNVTHVQAVTTGNELDALRGEDARITALESNKVNLPLNESLQPDYGSNGQILRTKGNGTTEWADVGLPTDEQTAQAISDYLDAHPEQTTTVQDGSLTYSKLAAMLKKSVIPAITDFGELTISTVTNIIADSNVKFLRCSGTLTTAEPIIIDRPITLFCEDFTVVQTVWGYPGIIVTADNVRIYGKITVISDVETRTPVTVPYYEEDTSDPKSNCTGIMLGHRDIHNDFYAEHITAKNFIAGVTNLSIGFTNINIDYLYVENVDFGVFGAHFISTHIKCLEFKNIASYIGSVDPSHAIYLTGGTTVGLSDGFIVDYIMGDGCNSKKSDAVISVKSTINFACNGGVVSGISALCSAITSTGYIQNIIVQDATAGISTQIENTDFTFRNLVFKKIDVSGEYINYFTNASHAKVIDCTFNVNSDDSDYTYIFVNGTGTEYLEKNCTYAAPANSTATLYKRQSAAAGFYVYEPKANLALFTGYLDMAKAYTLLDPKKLNYPKTNTLVPNPHFVPNDYIATEADSQNYPLGFRTNDKVKVTGASVAYFNTNNETNGVVYTLFNDGTSIINNGNRLKTKTGGVYQASDWTIFRFMNIGNVAYEI